MSKHIQITVPENIAEVIKQEADKEKLSVSAYISKSMASLLKGKKVEIAEPDLSVNKKHTAIALSDEDASVLRLKAKQAGLTDTAYIRQMIHTKDFTINEIKTSDLEDYIGEVHSAVASLNSLVSMIRKAGKGEVFKQDIEEVVGKANEIASLLQVHIEQTYKSRRKDYKKKERLS